MELERLYSLASPELRLPGEYEMRGKLIMCRDPKALTASKDQKRAGVDWRQKGELKTWAERRKYIQTLRPPLSKGWKVRGVTLRNT